MANPWLKKNPFLSLWLSGVNAVAGRVRGHAKRESASALTKATRDMVQLWTPAAPAAPARKKAKKRRKR